MTPTIKKYLFLAVALFFVLLFPRPYLHPRATIDNVLDDLLSHVLSEVQKLTGNGFSIQLLESSSSPRDNSQPASDSVPLRLCGLLSGKRLLFIGPDTTYYLHSLWLSALEPLEQRSHSCLGRDYCTFHHICQPLQRDLDLKTVPRSRKKKIPSRQTLLSDNSSLLLYSFSSTLYASPDKHDAAYILPQVDPYTRVRISNTFWRRQARKSDVILMNRPPVPAPTWTYPNGNWTFAWSLCVDNNYLAPLACDDTLENILMNAAIHTTVKHFLPSLLDTLHAVSLDPEVKNARLIWHSTWYIQPSCAKVALRIFGPQPWDIFSSEKGNGLTDSWSYYYNAQGYIHHRLLPTILPVFNVTYLSLERLSDPGPPYLRFYQGGQIPTSFERKDCIRHPWSNFRDALGQAFFDEIIRTLEVSS